MEASIGQSIVFLKLLYKFLHKLGTIISLHFTCAFTLLHPQNAVREDLV